MFTFAILSFFPFIILSFLSCRIVLFNYVVYWQYSMGIRKVKILIFWRDIAARISNVAFDIADPKSKQDACHT